MSILCSFNCEIDIQFNDEGFYTHVNIVFDVFLVADNIDLVVQVVITIGGGM